MRAISWRQMEPLTLSIWCAALAVVGSLVTQWPLRLDDLPPAARPVLMVLALAAFLALLLRPWQAGLARRLTAYGLAVPRAQPGGFLLLLLAVLVLNYASLNLLTWALEPDQVWVPVIEGVLDEPGGLAMLLVLLLLAAPLIEELLVRGRLQTGVARRWGVPAALAISATVFAWLHGLPSLVPVYVVFGLLLGFAVWLTGSVWTGVAIHAIHNGAVLGLFLLARALGAEVAEPPDAVTETESLLHAGLVALVLGTALLALALRVGHWERLRRVAGVRWRPLLFVGPPLAVVNLIPVVNG